MASFLLDTNICIYVHRKHPPAVLAKFSALKAGEAAISVVTLGELVFGAEKSAKRTQVLRQLEDFTALVPVLPLPAGAGQAYGVIRAATEQKGRPIGNNDLWIAAHALAANVTLVTNNEREFRRVPSLKIENWVD